MTTATATTWDGLAIAPDEPHGATIVVRRPIGGDRFAYLLLHRAHHGPDYAGPWAWTPPAGARQPGEAVEPAALRELKEEAGIDGTDIHPVDLSDRWARFYAEVGEDTAVDLIDVEHDDYRWVDPQTAGRMCLPSAVARQVPIADTIPGTVFTFRPATPDDTGDLLTWRAAPHIAPWAASTAADGAAGHIVLADGRPAGYAEHALADEPGLADVEALTGAARIGFLLADPDVVSHGLGATLLWAFLRQVVVPAHPGAGHIVAFPSGGNRPAGRALERAGFRRGGELADGRVVHALDRAHWFG
ncbi:MAG TPA: GNAT family N-acetyltransferase [Phytomonospora sp.]